MAKPFTDRVVDFIDRWSSEDAGSFEMTFVDGEAIIVFDCYLSRDLSNRPDHIWINHDSLGKQATDYSIDELVSIRDIEQGYVVLEVTRRTSE